MNLRIELKGGAMTASMRGALDHHTAGEMREQIDSTAKKVRPQKLILDFKEVPFMDSSGIGLILGRVRTAALWGGHVTVRGLSPQLKKMAERVFVFRIISFYDGRARPGDIVLGADALHGAV